MTDQMREQFEAWWLEYRGFPDPHDGAAWDAWQASRAALVVELPDADQEFEYAHGGTTYFDGPEYRGAVVKAIEAAGVKVKP